MSKRLIQDLHAGISRQDWAAVEAAANRLREDVEKTAATLAGPAIASLPNDYPLSRLAIDALNSERERCAQIAEGRSKSFDFQKALASHDDMAYGANTTRTEIALAIRDGYPSPLEKEGGE